MATTVDMITLKLVIDVNNQKVLFAEAGKDFVELLSSTLQYFPFSSDFSVGSLGKLSKSLENLDDRYTKPPSQVPDITCAFAASRVGNLTIPDPYVADIPDVLCPSCGDPMTYTLYFFSYYTSGVGYKQEDIIFMIMDNLEVKPMLTISNIIAELNQLNGGVEEKTVHLGTSQVLDLLKASLESTTVLTDIFLENKSVPKFAPIAQLGVTPKLNESQPLAKSLQEATQQVLLSELRQDQKQLLAGSTLRQRRCCNRTKSPFSAYRHGPD